MLYSETFPNAEIVARRERIKADYAAANGTAQARRRPSDLPAPDAPPHAPGAKVGMTLGPDRDGPATIR